MAEQLPRHREGVEDSGDQWRGLRQDGGYCFQVVCRPSEERQNSLHHLDRRNQGTRRSPSLFLHQAFPKPLLGMPQSASPHASSSHLRHRHPSWLREDRPHRWQQLSLQLSPSDVAVHIVRAIEKGKEVKVIDWRYSLLVFFWHLLPRWIWTRMRITS